MRKNIRNMLLGVKEAKSLIEIRLQTERSLKGKSPAEVDRYIDEQRSRLVKAYGSEQAYAEKLKVVKDFVSRADLKHKGAALIYDAPAISAVEFNFLLSQAENAIRAKGK